MKRISTSNQENKRAGQVRIKKTAGGAGTRRIQVSKVLIISPPISPTSALELAGKLWQARLIALVKIIVPGYCLQPPASSSLKV